MLSYTLFDYLSDVFQAGSQLLLLIVTKSNVVGDFAIIPNSIHSILELESRFLKLSFLVQNTCLVDDNIGILLVALPQERLGMLDLILFVPDERLQQNNFL